MKLAIDVRWMVGNYRGMGRFGHQLIEPIRQHIVALGPKSLDQAVGGGVYKGGSFFPWWEQWHLSRLAKKEEVDFIICPYNTGPIFGSFGLPLVVVIHDLIFMESWSDLPASTSFYQTFGRIYRRYLVPLVAKRAAYIVTVSEYTKSQLISKLGVDASKITVIPNAIKSLWYKGDIVPRSDRKNYLFTVTGEAPSKNIERLIYAYAKSRNSLPEGMKLIIAGVSSVHHTKYSELLKKLNLLGAVEFDDFLTEEQLMERYRYSSGFVYASLFEGFGIPPLEALATGTPVACSDSTSIPEVVGGCAILFNPRDVEEIAKGIVQIVCMDDDEYNETVLAGRRYSERFAEGSVLRKIEQFWRGVGCL